MNLISMDKKRKNTMSQLKKLKSLLTIDKKHFFIQ